MATEDFDKELMESNKDLLALDCASIREDLHSFGLVLDFTTEFKQIALISQHLADVLQRMFSCTPLRKGIIGKIEFENILDKFGGGMGGLLSAILQHARLCIPQGEKVVIPRFLFGNNDMSEYSTKWAEYCDGKEVIGRSYHISLVPDCFIGDIYGCISTQLSQPTGFWNNSFLVLHKSSGVQYMERVTSALIEYLPEGFDSGTIKLLCTGIHDSILLNKLTALLEREFKSVLENSTSSIHFKPNQKGKEVSWMVRKGVESTQTLLMVDRNISIPVSRFIPSFNGECRFDLKVS